MKLLTKIWLTGAGIIVLMWLALMTPVPAHAACTPIAPIGNLQPFMCDSDNQATDGDDVKFFIDKATGVENVEGSLNKNTSNPSFQNIAVASNSPATFSQEGNGFAELHSSMAGSFTNILRDVTFTPILPSTLDQKTPIPFVGFDGFFGRGQVDPTGGTAAHPTWDGEVQLLISFVGGTSQTLTFLGDTKKDDFGSIGFDEITEPGLLVSSVTMRVDGTGAFNEVKQFDFSVPGAVPSAIPEPRTWVLTLAGFGLLAWTASRRRQRQNRFLSLG